VESFIGVQVRTILFFETLGGAVAALKSGQADAVHYVGPSLAYYTLVDSDLKTLLVNQPVRFNSHMMFPSRHISLRDRVNTVLTGFAADGTLARLERDFITDMTPAMSSAGKVMPRIAGAPTYIVGVVGDVPPIDYIAADGRPVGYSAELLSLVSEALGVNFEVIVLPAESKYPALNAGRIDMSFLHFLPEVDLLDNAASEAARYIFTVPYYSFTEKGFLVLK
jgi:ABC-type amino acid transport substrate-binding protein